MSLRTSPPFRADHVGSLLRPKSINEAFKNYKAGKISLEERKLVEDSAIKEVIEMQESVGLRSITDGEFRRASYWSTFVERVDGLDIDESRFSFHDNQGNNQKFTAPIVKHKITRPTTIAGDEFDFIKANTNLTPKVTIVSPPTMHMFRLDKTIQTNSYKDRADYFNELAAIYRQEINDLADRGCTYIQLDDVPIPMLSDPKIREKIEADDINPSKLLDDYIKLFNESLSECPEDMTAAIHMCRGNYKGKYLSEGGYQTYAEKFFSELNVNAYFLEYDSPRAGDFEPLKYVPKDKIIVLGLISSKNPLMEPSEDLKYRIEEASKFIDLEQLALSPQCGFASTVAGNPIGIDEQKRKLELTVQVAEHVWA